MNSALIRLWLTAALVLLPVTETLASWRGNTGLRASAILSDNIFLDSDDGESGSVLQVRPYINSSRRGSRVDSRLSYGPAFVWYPAHSELNDIRHTLSARLSAELIERYFFVDVRADANQALIDPRVNSGFDRFANPDAFTQRASLRVTPRVRLPILGGRFATVRIEPGLGYELTASTADDGDGFRTPTRDTRVRITSGPMFTNAPWSLNWRRQVFDADTDQGVGELYGRVGYVFSPRYRLDLILGYDESRDAFRTGGGDTDGFRWETIFRWTPNTRARFEFGMGERYFGETYRFNGTYRHKRWAFRARYDVTIQSAVTELQQEEVVPVRDLFGNPIPDPFATDEILTATVTTPVLVDDTFLRDRLELHSAYRKGRNAASVRWWVTRREYDQRDLDTLDNQVRFQFSRRLSTRLTASASVDLWDHSEDNPNAFDFFQDELNLGLSYRVGPQASLGARIGRLKRDVDGEADDFSEHRLSMDFNVRF
ncbi:TIGR03016 family PEP-CTERM system-associated outer membrane protein [Thiohalocapsa sp.]|uniref:TIGR03016 family PEP-CTERM system-associated outer membrane protein n=1 Tax=Thiohalocapsa sp. TaxID=2497641 RepID=UPI0025D9E124|nr:TIGR03016 family PEP-CTERM system-associated outer membrane protein [Thiohalocapsa sp.]